MDDFELTNPADPQSVADETLSYFQGLLDRLVASGANWDVLYHVCLLVIYRKSIEVRKSSLHAAIDLAEESVRLQKLGPQLEAKVHGHNIH